jgi:hypothetical protein
MGMDNWEGRTLERRFQNCLVFLTCRRNHPHDVRRMKRENGHIYLHLKKKFRMHGALIQALYFIVWCLHKRSIYLRLQQYCCHYWSVKSHM